MYAIVEIAGQQFKVEEGKKIFVHRLKAENGSNVEFDQVLLIEDKGKVIVGEPVIKDALVEGKVLEHLKGDKVIVFKKKRRKGYRVKNGHRQYFTQVEIVSIKEKAQRKPSQKKEAVSAEIQSEAEVIAVPVNAAEAKTSETPSKNSDEGVKKTRKKTSPEVSDQSKPKAVKKTKSEE